MKIHHDIEFVKLGKKLKHAKDINEKITILKEIAGLKPRDPKNLAKRTTYKAELESLAVKKKAQKHAQPQSIYESIKYKRQVALTGMTNSGKSTLLSKLTDTTPEINNTPFATYNPEAGMMNYNDVPIQLVEVPSIYQGDSDPDKYRFIKNANVLCLCIKSREEFNTILKQLQKRSISKPAFIASWESIEETDLPVIDINDEDAIRRLIYEILNIKRIYSIAQGILDDKPSVFPKGKKVNITDFVKALDKRLLQKFSRARITGPSAKHEKQVVSFNHILADGDKVELIK